MSIAVELEEAKKQIEALRAQSAEASEALIAVKAEIDLHVKSNAELAATLEAAKTQAEDEKHKLELAVSESNAALELAKSKLALEHNQHVTEGRQLPLADGGEAGPEQKNLLETFEAMPYGFERQAFYRANRVEIDSQRRKK